MTGGFRRYDSPLPVVRVRKVALLSLTSLSSKEVLALSYIKQADYPYGVVVVAAQALPTTGNCLFYTQLGTRLFMLC